MRAIMTAGLGFALAVSGLAFAVAPVSAVEAPAVSVPMQKNITKVDDRDRDRERCERVRRECRERHHEHAREYRECVEREHCEP